MANKTEIRNITEMLQKMQDVDTLGMLIIGSVLSVMLINRYVIGEPVHPASYMTLFAIVIILIFHHVRTRDFYSKVKNMG